MYVFPKVMLLSFSAIKGISPTLPHVVSNLVLTGRYVHTSQRSTQNLTLQSFQEIDKNSTTDKTFPNNKASISSYLDSDHRCSQIQKYIDKLIEIRMSYTHTSKLFLHAKPALFYDLCFKHMLSILPHII